MRGLSKKEKLEFILEKVSELGFSAYEISKEIKLTEAGVSRILKGIAKKPHETSLDEILLFLERKVLGIDIDKVAEPEAEYKKTNIDINKYIECIETENKLRKEIQRLKNILRTNKIEFTENLED
jgi:transcriptional regulator with XRE-family HTH domain